MLGSWKRERENWHVFGQTSPKSSMNTLHWIKKLEREGSLRFSFLMCVACACFDEWRRTWALVSERTCACVLSVGGLIHSGSTR